MRKSLFGQVFAFGSAPRIASARKRGLLKKVLDEDSSIGGTSAGTYSAHVGGRAPSVESLSGSGKHRRRTSQACCGPFEAVNGFEGIARAELG
jgi:hypothetical protein